MRLGCAGRCQADGSAAEHDGVSRVKGGAPLFHRQDRIADADLLGSPGSDCP